MTAQFLPVLAAAVFGASVASADDKPQTSGSLPLGRVVLFSSGVGFYEHAGKVEGDATVDLKFNVEDINDLLKSMVLQDFGGGKISTVNYGSKDPITNTLKTFAIDLTTNPTLADLLGQIRGEKVQVDAPTPSVGTILGVERRKVRGGKDEETVEVDYLNLLTDEGLRSVSLDSVSRIKLLDEKLNAELQQALLILAGAHATDKKTVSLNFLGNGQRDVRVGYIQESPIWKTSYRLVLDDKEAPFLQGWAIVENTTEQDWNDVNLTLVSGRPISFVMDLYQPLYVQRPVVEPELYASLRPQKYGQDLAEKQAEFEKLSQSMSLRKPTPAAELRPARLAADTTGDRSGGGRGEEGKQGQGVNLQHGGQSMAQAGDVGEMFQYVIATPVSLPRQQSAMLPIVNGSVKGERVSIYNQAVQAKHPLNGLKLTNSTDLHLMQGPMTVFDGGAYAGDAQIEDLPPGTERLISYALDLDTEVAPESKPVPKQLISVKIAKGVLHATRKFTREQKYVVKNSGDKAKNVLIEQPFQAEWSLVTPEKPAEKTRDLYRFAVTAEPGKPAELVVREEQIAEQQVALTNTDDNAILFYLNAKVVSDKVKAALAEIVKRKQAIGEMATKRHQLEQQVAVVGQEQERIRQNMAQLDRNTDLYNRYVKKFGEQEDQVESLRKPIATLTDQEAQLHKSLEEFMMNLDLS